ncbi:hypothetical protein [Sphaerisporangium fuscum]|uniref:hypothetical protein n=1 Tax=Sphaerisporangium fuscum TaxID=2835868 RepID=UPI001BDC1058|nr:hypothetical protein [Sphaerisporangium fuscum]
MVIWLVVTSVLLFIVMFAVSIYAVFLQLMPRVVVPEILSGNWVGYGRLEGTDQLYVVRVSLISGWHNGRVDYPLHDCSGSIVPREMSGGWLVTQEHLDKSSGCSDGTLEFRKGANGQLDLRIMDQVITLQREPDGGSFRLPDSIVGSWTSKSGLEFVLDNNTPGLSGSVRSSSDVCVFAPIHTAEDGATLVAGGSTCDRNGIWTLIARDSKSVSLTIKDVNEKTIRKDTLSR